MVRPDHKTNMVVKNIQILSTVTVYGGPLHRQQIPTNTLKAELFSSQAQKRIRLVLQLRLHHVGVDELLCEGGHLLLHTAPLDVFVCVVTATAEPLVVLVIMYLEHEQEWMID